MKITMFSIDPNIFLWVALDALGQTNVDLENQASADYPGKTMVFHGFST